MDDDDIDDMIWYWWDLDKIDEIDDDIEIEIEIDVMDLIIDPDIQHDGDPLIGSYDWSILMS